jgi:phosphopantothenoylcysteine decarboxylase/phosphopantothenate--cysteine ligase
MPVWYRKRPLVTLSRGDAYLFVDAERGSFALRGVDVDALATIFDLTTAPVPRERLLEEADEATIDRLVELGALETCPEPPPAPDRPPQRRCSRLVVCVTGTVAATSAHEWVQALADHFATEVDVVLTRGARKFTQERTFAYRGLRTWTDPFRPRHGAAVPHVHLAQRAELVLIAPASAATIARLASGACDDLVSLIVSATTAPVVVAPAMNPQMWRHPPIARNVAQLRADGLWLLDPGIGYEVSARDQTGVGGMGGVDAPRLFRALDAVLTETRERAT